jgi:AcrR family transcriptional regulator
MSDLKPATHSKTKDQLLEHAVPLFAKKGYRDATCADLSKLAGANIAAINYHFGSKENLYRLSLRRAFELANAKYAFDGGLTTDAEPEEKLLASMDALIRRIFDQGPAGYLSKMMAHQASRPTAPQELVMEEIMKLQGNHLLSTIKEITGNLPHTTLQAAKVNIIALCVFPSLAPAMSQLLFPNTPTAEEIDQMIQRQYQFALAGLRSLTF